MTDSTRGAENTVFKDFKNWLRNGLRSKGECGKKAETVLDDLDKQDFENFADWCAEGNYFGFYKEDVYNDENKRDEKKNGWSADRAANELTVTTFGGVAATTLGAALLPFCPLLGILIIAGGNIPRPVFNALRKEVNERTFGLLPLDELPSPTAELSDAAHKTHDNINAQMKRFKKVVEDTESLLKQQAEREKGQAKGAMPKSQTEIAKLREGRKVAKSKCLGCRTV